MKKNFVNTKRVRSVKGYCRQIKEEKGNAESI